MSLFQASRDFWLWLGRVLGQFLRIRAILTITAIVATALSRIFGLLAFLLPLKVILLLGSDGVPRYFQFFMSAEDKMPWVIGLSFGAVGLYILSIAMEALANRCAHVGSAWVLREANELTLVNRQDDVAREHFARVCSAYAALLFILIAFIAGALLNIWLFALLAGIMTIQYLISAFLLSRRNYGGLQRAGAYIEDHAKEYVDILASTNILLVFGCILIQFLWFSLDNLIIALVSFLLCRQLLQNVSSFLTDSVRLTQHQSTINALVFREHQFLPAEKSIFQDFRRLFASSTRPTRIEQVRDLAGLDATDSMTFHWVDSSSPGIASFEWVITEASGEIKQKFLERVHFPIRYAALEHETFLFKHMDPAKLMALPQLFQRTVDEFQCQFYEFGRRVPKQLWQQQAVEVRRHFLALEPPKPLQQAYFGSKPILDAVLSDDFIMRLDVAVDSPQDSEEISRLTSVLPTICERIRQLPLYIHNPEIGPASAVLLSKKDLRFSGWGRWVLEPVGYGMKMAPFSEDEIETLVSAVASRDDCPADFSANDLWLIAALSRFEDSINKQNYRAALDLIPRIMEMVLYHTKRNDTDTDTRQATL